MARFKWTAKDVKGRKLSGELEAVNQSEILSLLTAQRLQPIQVKQVKAKPLQKLTAFDTLPIKEKLFFIQSFMIMLKTGVPILDAIESMEKESKQKVVRHILSSMREAVLAGKPLFTVFQQYNRYFPPIYSSLIKGGEETGRLSDSMQIVYEQLERDYQLISKIRSATIYPSILVVGVFGVLAVMFGFVLPKLQEVFVSGGIELHPVTEFVFAASNFVRGNLFLVIFLPLILLLAFIVLLIKRSTRTRAMIWLMRAPIIGSILKNVQLIRFSHSLSASLISGLSFPESLGLTAEVLQGRYRIAMRRFTTDIEKGVSLTSLLETERDLFPGTITQIVAVGEKTGQLPQVLQELAKFYQQETDTKIGSVLSLIEPVLILVMGVVVGFVAVSIVLTILTSVAQF